MKIAICDDEQMYVKEISESVLKILEEENVSCELVLFNSGHELIEAYKQQKFDTILLDIDMPNMSGFEVAQKLQKINRDVIIVFITNHEDKVYQSWEFQPFWFVRKSHINDLEIVLPRLFIKINSMNEKENEIFHLNIANRSIEININKVRYIQSFRHYILIRDTDRHEEKIRCKLSEAEQQMYPLYFIRVQNSVIVNCRFISKVSSRSIILKDGEEVTISRDRVEYIKNEFQRFIRSR